MIKFSIIIPTYNRSNFLLDSINSVLLQTYQNFEIIVVDDASTDNTEMLVNSIVSQKLRYIKKTKNAERGAARNTGSNVANGDYVYFHDSDDILYPNHLAEAVKIIENNPQTVFFTLGYELIKHDPLEKNKPISYLNEKKGNLSGNLNKKLIKGNFLSCKVFLQRDLAIEFPFNESRNLSGSEDYELWLRIAARFPLDYSNKITSALMLHTDRSVQNEDSQKLINRILILESNIAHDQVAFECYKPQFKNFASDNRSYIALHLAMSDYKILALKYLFKSLLKSPVRLLSTKRFYAIVRIMTFG